MKPDNVLGFMIVEPADRKIFESYPGCFDDVSAAAHYLSMIGEGEKITHDELARVWKWELDEVKDFLYSFHHSLDEHGYFIPQKDLMMAYLKPEEIEKEELKIMVDKDINSVSVGSYAGYFAGYILPKFCIKKDD